MTCATWNFLLQELFLCAEQEHSIAKCVVTHLEWDSSVWAQNHLYFFPASPLISGELFTTEIGTPIQSCASGNVQQRLEW